MHNKIIEQVNHLGDYLYFPATSDYVFTDYLWIDLQCHLQDLSIENLISKLLAIASKVSKDYHTLFSDA